MRRSGRSSRAKPDFCAYISERSAWSDLSLVARREAGFSLPDSSSSDSKAYLGAYLEPWLKRALLERARRADRSLSAELRIALRYHLDLPEDLGRETQTATSQEACR